MVSWSNQAQVWCHGATKPKVWCHGATKPKYGVMEAHVWCHGATKPKYCVMEQEWARLPGRLQVALVSGKTTMIGGNQCKCSWLFL